MPEVSSKKHSRGEWERLMASYEASDMTQRAFCAQHGLAYSSFCYWRKRLRTSQRVKDEVVPLVELSGLALDKASGWRVELDLGAGVVLRMR